MKNNKGWVKKVIAIFMAFVIAWASLPIKTTYAASSYSGVCRTIYDITQVFPESYREALIALKEAHPNWNFVAFYTGLDWNSCFTASAEMYPSRNLLQKNYSGNTSSYMYPTSWYSTTVEGAYSFAGNDWTVMSAPNWIQASEEAVRYCMDPRNWLTEEQIFQFYDNTSYSGMDSAYYHAVYSVFASEGSGFWTRSGEESDIYYEILVPVETTEPETTETENTDTETIESPEESSETVTSESQASDAGSESESSSKNSETEESTEVQYTTQKVYLTYTEAILRIVDELKAEYDLDINPVVLASRLVQEQGSGKSALISGTYSFVPDGQSEAVSGYYNYFNIEATDGSGNANYDLIVTNGLKEAYRGGWNTRYEALKGGAKKFVQNYVKNGQVTYYMQKFNVDSSSNRLFWGQYMQSLTTPQSEARRLYNSYSSYGILNEELTFVIPVFANMSANPEPKPVKDGNPNYKLSNIYVNGNPIASVDTDDSFSDFNTDVLSYTVEVPYETATADLSVFAYASSAMVLINGEDEKGSFSSSESLSVGDNVYQIDVTAENGDSRTYTVNIHRNELIITPEQKVDSSLRSLRLNGSEVEDFSPNVTEYRIVIPYTYSTVSLEATASYFLGTVQIFSGADTGNGIAWGPVSGEPSEGAGANLSLNVGTNEILVRVTAYDGSVTDYLVHLIMARNEDLSAKLSSITLNGSSIPGFYYDNFSYTVSVPEEVTQAEVTVSSFFEDTMINADQRSEWQTMSMSLPLSIGLNSFQIVLTDNEGRLNTYEITIERKENIVIGDASGDSQINSLDLAYIVSHLLGNNVLTGDYFRAADVTGDGVINSLDLAYMVSYLLGNITAFPAEG